ncbi:MAG: NRDE family protein [Gammaproteobacteria bacterium]|jgi:uncharacterized protein with NRDE domain|nr:NRDE family protein [Gammaproteobacteria bacterium]MBP6051471.1 NRDE family protein [Pseudomonadales bacterium]MBK6582757.1 NRDE family protein [Gammaproteobacteria bacterium]MBK7171250.1 NRDE family protein [Gammaproteobacteria bacterium]MBK7518886.1 NRDE family protein [Gammaproteobacteria bacterium]
MCLIVIAWRSHRAYPLLIGANRDEFHDRPSLPAGFWCDAPQLCAGRDLLAGGSWLGITRGGRFAALTNFRAPEAKASNAPSRGELVSAFLRGSDTPRSYLEQLQPQAARHAGFNLLLGELGGELYYFSNRADAIRRLEPGVYGLSNHLLDTPWPKVRAARANLAALIEAEPGTDEIFALLGERSLPPAHELPDTGVGQQHEQLLAPCFIVSERYGTRASTVVRVSREGRVEFEEHSFDARGKRQQTVAHRFRIT